MAEAVFQRAGGEHQGGEDQRVGLVVFGAASLWAAYAGDANQLIAARAAMGIGAAFIMPANFAILL
ncbi:hypothetical protein V1227_08610 [Lentzea sp. DG1S-22]|uniref:hypothetical protein n=1 Tax=Lentzea sp. DG1S-22 TaxID=3108822 RepID=UPI002E762144|nr:hypothetical protein [Lentzea sp. DG1S-22]WVH82797.1 hypothetical protein V1227_08610 [Lentzea sp. DG1S-22]